MVDGCFWWFRIKSLKSMDSNILAVKKANKVLEREEEAKTVNR